MLGTGPLIDPGYWGKLCIPLHNLTDHDYNIPKDEGLIWIEFTKTTTPPERVADQIGRPPLDEGQFFGDITDFLGKAAKQYGLVGVPIRSALPTMFDGAETSALNAETSALNAEKAAKSTRNWVAGLGGAAVLATVIGLFSIFLQANSIVQDASSNIRGVEGVVNEAKKSSEQQRQNSKKMEDVERRLIALEQKR